MLRPAPCARLPRNTVNRSTRGKEFGRGCAASGDQCRGGLSGTMKGWVWIAAATGTAPSPGRIDPPIGRTHDGMGMAWHSAAQAAQSLLLTGDLFAESFASASPCGRVRFFLTCWSSEGVTPPSFCCAPETVETDCRCAEPKLQQSFVAAAIPWSGTRTMTIHTTRGRMRAITRRFCWGLVGRGDDGNEISHLPGTDEDGCGPAAGQHASSPGQRALFKPGGYPASVSASANACRSSEESMVTVLLVRSTLTWLSVDQAARLGDCAGAMAATHVG